MSLLDAEPDRNAAADAQAHERLIAELMRPGALAGWDGPVTRIDTHISTLLLAGERVFKLKKPVRLGFVDFSTGALRQDACEQELRLNRRTAPRLYLGVVAVHGGPQGAQIDAPGRLSTQPAPVLDWAVQMRRFDEAQRFDRLCAAGLLGRVQIDALAAAVARFHAGLVPAPPGYGSAPATRHWARSNLEELAVLVTPGAEPQQPAWTALAPAVAALQAWCEARGAALAPLMALRAITGHVREGHGDLHLANIVWADGAPLLFDALEFSDTLRHIDTLGDLAFPFMDLLAQGLPRLAWRFISQVLEASGDHAALPLLAWWAAYRAAVRAKVALLSGGPDALADARRYLGVALQQAGLPPLGAAAVAVPARPALLLCMGLSGSGKSTVAAQLAERLHGVRLRSDVERKRLHGLAPNERPTPSAGLYTPQATARTYERLAELAEGALSAGVPVVVDAAALLRRERDALAALAQRLGLRFGTVCCQAPLPVLQARVAQRLAQGGDASDATPAVLALQQQFAEWPGADEAARTLLLDTDRPPAELARACEALALPS